MTYAIILAGGSGTRMGTDVNKVLLPLLGVPALVRSARAFVGLCGGILLVVRPQDETAVRHMMDSHGVPVYKYALSGADRQASVQNGLHALPEDCDIVLVHDGARALVTQDIIRRVIASVQAHGSGVAAVPVIDTLKEADSENRITRSLDRSCLRAMQTPQGFKKALLLRAHANAERLNHRGTDEAELVSLLNEPVHLTLGARENIKLTTPEDLLMADAFLSQRGEGLPPFRVGQGYDVHRLVSGRKLILCGVEVPHEMGLLGHSDADVALHALTDAMLGAAGLYDIGRHFPDTDAKYLDASSMALMAKAVEMLLQAGWRVVNADVTIIAQRPKLLPYMEAMRMNVAGVLGLPPEYINIKATTTERLGFEGEEKGISATAVCLIQRIA